MSDKIKYWWSEDRKFFCILVNDGVNQTTVSLSVEEADALMDQVMQTPKYLAFQKECQDHALHLLAEAALPPCDCAATTEGKWANVHGPGCATLRP